MHVRPQIIKENALHALTGAVKYRSIKHAGGGYLHWRPPSVVLLHRWSCLNFSSRNWDEEGGRLCVKMAVGGKCGKFSGSSVGYLAGGG